ncbi:hypothetical protein ACTWP4_08250 [Gracilibacillus sp. D59]
MGFTEDVEIKDEVNQILAILSRFDRELQHIVRLKIFGDYTLVGAP